MPDEAIGTSIDPAVILGELLEKLRDPAVAPPSDAAAEAAIELCGQLAAHLRMSLNSPGLVMMQVTAADGPAAEAEPNAGAGTCCAPAAACTCAASEAGTDSACVTSESDSDHTSTHSRSRPSARARARLLRRRQEQGQQEQEQEQHGQQQLLQGASTGPADLQWQQWQWQWQGIGTHTHAPGQPLPRLQEHQVQQEEHFRSSLWNGGWVMAPVALAAPMAVPMAAPMAPSPPYHPYDPRRPAATSSAQQPQRLRHARDQPPRVRAPPSEAAFQQQLWSGGWQMVPLQEEPSSETPARAQSGQPRWRGKPPTQPPTEPPAEPPQPPTRPPQPPPQPPEEQQQQQQQGAHGEPGQQGEEEVYIVQQQQQQRHEKQQQQRPLHEKQPRDGDQGAADGGARDPGDLPACREEGSPEAIQTRPRGGEPEHPQGLPQGLPQGEREDANEEEEAPRGGREVVEGGGSEPSSEAWSEA